MIRVACCALLATASATSDRVIIWDHSGTVHSQKETAGDVIHVEELADVIARAMGVLPFQEDQAAPLWLQTSFFKRPRANLVVSLPHISLEDANNMPQVAALHKGENTHGVVRSMSLEISPHSSNLAAQATLSTTRAPHEHGVRSGSKSSPLLVPTLADRLAESFGGQSLTVSASACARTAQLWCRHPKLAESHKESTRCMGSETPASAEALRTALTDPTSVFSVLPRADLAALSLESPQDRLVLSELYALLTELRVLETESGMQRLVRDDVPDLLAFSFSSLENASPAALRLVDSAVMHILKAAQSLYPDRLLAELILFGDRLATADDDVVVQSSRRLLSNVGAAADLPVTANQIAEYQISVWISVIIAFALFAVLYYTAFMDVKKDTLLYSTFNPRWDETKKAR